MRSVETGLHKSHIKQYTVHASLIEGNLDEGRMWEASTAGRAVGFGGCNVAMRSVLLSDAAVRCVPRACIGALLLS